MSKGQAKKRRSIQKPGLPKRLQNKRFLTSEKRQMYLNEIYSLCLFLSLFVSLAGCLSHIHSFNFSVPSIVQLLIAFFNVTRFSITIL